MFLRQASSTDPDALEVLKSPGNVDCEEIGLNVVV